MTVPISSAHRYGNPVFDCSGATIRAQCRHLANVVTIRGTIDDANADRVSAHIARYVPTEQAFILDLSGVDVFTSKSLAVLDRLDDECRAAGVDWAMIAGPAANEALCAGAHDAIYPVMNTVRQALRHFADAISNRRRFLLPLLNKSA